MAISSSPTVLSVESLRTEFPGRVIAPGDKDYDQARTILFGGIDKHPAVIIKVEDANEVARVIELARETGLELAVRCGGHSNAGHGTTEGGILLDLSPMKAIEIDEASQTVWAQGGLTAVELSKATHEHGLAIGFGDTGSVGIGGITTGGGVGYLVRKHGLTIDSLLAAEVVTADGQLLLVDADTHPDLFWAIRGGGGNFGVVTNFKYQLHPVDTVVGGLLILPATTASIVGFMAAAASAPEGLSTIANVMPAPPMPGVPEEVQGQVVIFGILCWAGNVEAGEQAIAPFRALGTPILDMVKPIPYPEIYPPEDPDYHPLAISRTMFMDHVDREVAETMLDRLRTSDATLRAVQLRPLGGAYARVPADATAYAHRSSPIMTNLAVFHDGTEADIAKRTAWVEELHRALNQGDDGAYVNFLTDEGPGRVRAAYPGTTWDRLVETKRKYDPTNLFHMNQNIPPEPVD